MRRVWALVVLVPVAFLVGRMLTPVRTRTVRVEVPVSDPAPVARGDVATLARLDDLARRVDELAARDATAPVVVASATAPADDRAAPEPSASQLEAADHAGAIVDAALADGVWSDADRHALLAAGTSLDPQARDELVRRVMVAINRGQVKAEADPY